MQTSVHTGLSGAATLKTRPGRFRSLQARFLALNVPLVLLAVAVLFGLFEYNAYKNAQAELQQKLERIVASQSQVLSESVWTLDTERIQLILSATTDDPDIRGAAVYDDMGNFLAAVGQTGDTDSAEFSAEQPIVYSYNGTTETIGQLKLSLTDGRVHAAMEERLLMAGVLAVLIVLSVVVSALAANRWTIGIPLQRLLHSIDRTESGGIRHPVQWDSRDEVGAVVKAFNRMQARQQRYEDELHKARDQLERRVAERTAELAQARDAAEAANKAKTDFLANMSHELRTPLNAVIGFAEVLEQELLGQLGNARYREYANDIRESGTHLLSLINDLLDLSKAEAGKLELNEEIFDLCEATTTSIAMVQPRADATGIALVNALPERTVRLRGDSRKIKQVLLNLLTNAVKFTPSGGQVRVELRHRDDAMEICVCDTGIGIATDDLNRAMQPFAQINSGLNRNTEGTGLGLPLVKSLVELHGGTIQLESAPDQGTCVAVRLPQNRIKHSVFPAARAPRPAGAQDSDASEPAAPIKAP